LSAIWHWALNSVVDITERKRAEAALHETEERFENIADTVPVMIWVSGPDKLCTFVNKVWLEFTGRTMEQELGNGWTADVYPDDLDHCLDTYSTAFDVRRNFKMEYRVRRRDGEYRWVLDSGVPRFSTDGVFAGYIGSCIDITEIKRTQDAALARQQLESLEVLTGYIAHDFGNILSSIIANAELLQEDLGPGSPAAKEVQSIIDVAVRGSEIVHELMINTRNDRSKLELLDVSVLVQEMIEQLKIPISKHATLETHFGKGLPPVLARATHIRKIVMNLIINAVKAIGEDPGRIEITTSYLISQQDSAFNIPPNLPEAGYVLLEVSDTGIGMTPEVQTRIFDPFFTTKPENRRAGLAVIQAIVHRYGGVINVKSAPGQGTRFAIMLPCASEGARQSRSAQTGD
jgi:PAS domain S-box-containing protein